MNDSMINNDMIAYLNVYEILKLSLLLFVGY